MTLEQAIQQRWGDDDGLTALVPTQRLFTGFAPADAARPYVVVERRKSRPTLRGSGGLQCAAVELVFRLEAANYDQAAAIAAAVAERFDSADFAADFDAGEGRVVQMRRGEELRTGGARGASGSETVGWELLYEITLCTN